MRNEPAIKEIKIMRTITRIFKVSVFTSFILGIIGIMIILCK